MAAKLLHSLADDNPDLQKQIGCMTGIFQVFDRHHFLSGKRPNQRRLLPPPSGNSKISNGSLDADSSNPCNGEVVESNSNKCVNDKRASPESSRPSFTSTSCSSSFSSLDCGRTGQREPSSKDHPETPSSDPVINHTSASPRTGRLSVDLRGVVKDSMYRDSRGLSVQTKIKEDGSANTLKHKDSPRPLQFSKSVNGLVGVGMKGKQDVPTDIKESLRILVKLHDAPWYYTEKEIPILSHEMEGRSCMSISTDAPRFSCDDREADSNIKDLPRLSLDSRQSSARSIIVDSKLSHLPENVNKTCDYSDERVGDLEQLSSNQPRPSSVVAKLMGLDMFPATRSSSEIHLGLVKTLHIEDHDPSIVPLRIPDVCKPFQLLKSPRRSRKEPASPQLKNADQVMKPTTTSSKFPIEPAPWKHLNSCRSSPKRVSRQVKPSGSSLSTSSVYPKIHDRLKDIEFTQSEKHVRHLKQKPKAMQTKRPSEVVKEQSLSLENMRDGQRFGSDRNSKMKCPDSRTSRASGSTLRGSSRATALESSIVVMKPAKLVQNSGIPASSIIPIDGFPDLRRSQSVEFLAHRKKSAICKMTKDQNAKDGCRDQAATADRGTNNRTLRAAQTSSRLSQVDKDNKTSTLKNSGSVSPRLQQKRLESDKRSRPPTPLSDSNKVRRQPNGQSTESGSPGGRRRPNKNDEQLSERSSQPRILICQEISTSVHPKTHVAQQLTLDVEATSNEQHVEIASCRSPSLEAFEGFMSWETKNDLNLRLDEEDAVGDLSTAPEQPSPVSVLDLSSYMEDCPSPVKRTSTAHKAAAIAENNSTEDLKNAIDGLSSTGTVLELPSKISHKKLQNIENLVQKLRCLNSTHDESQTDYIASLCESTNPDDRYISEILVTSGLLLRDLTSGLTAFQLHPSGHPINPELFFVLEQTKASSLIAQGESTADGIIITKYKPEKLHRKLVFDVVNEILAGKLSTISPPAEPWFNPDRLAKKALSAQVLLKELCIEIDLLQAKKQDFSIEQEEDGMKNILCEDMMHRSGKWMDIQSDVSGIVLDVERSIFKELVNEVVMGEAAAHRGWVNRRCKQLFSN